LPMTCSGECLVRFTVESLLPAPTGGHRDSHCAWISFRGAGQVGSPGIAPTLPKATYVALEYGGGREEQLYVMTDDHWVYWDQKRRAYVDVRSPELRDVVQSLWQVSEEKQRP
jgi:hypothetical protein